jgi:SAM-dependent methyltransferase
MAHLRSLTNLLPQPVRFALRRAAFAGTAVTCPLCGHGVRGYGPNGGGPAVLDRRRVVGGMRRAATACPVCRGMDRTRLMMLALQRELGAGSRPLRVLHTAPDFGLYLWLNRQPGVTQVCADIDRRRYRHIPGLIELNLERTGLPDAGFDAVLSSHVLEHVPDDRAAFAEIRRILRPGGTALLLAPFALDGAGTDEDPAVTDPAERTRRFGQWDHVRLYDRDDFVARMAAAGLAARLWDPFAAAPAEAAALGLNRDELLPMGRRPD